MASCILQCLFYLIFILVKTKFVVIRRFHPYLEINFYGIIMVGFRVYTRSHNYYLCSLNARVSRTFIRRVSVLHTTFTERVSDLFTDFVSRARYKSRFLNVLTYRETINNLGLFIACKQY